MLIKDRIVELRRVPASELRANPANWRTHPPRQRAALQSVLDQIGYADALLARQLPDGGLELIDGHLRAETTPDQHVPVLVVDVTAEEAQLLLATLDPLAALAQTDRTALGNLLASIDADNDALRITLDGIAERFQRDDPCGADGDHRANDPAVDGHPASRGQISDKDGHRADRSPPNRREVTIRESYHVLVHCGDEDEQEAVYDLLTSKGHSCRVLML